MEIWSFAQPQVQILTQYFVRISLWIEYLRPKVAFAERRCLALAAREQLQNLTLRAGPYSYGTRRVGASPLPDRCNQSVWVCVALILETRAENISRLEEAVAQTCYGSASRRFFTKVKKEAKKRGSPLKHPES